MSDLNFIPRERIESRKAEGVSGKFKLFAAILGFVCVAIGVGGSAFLYYHSNKVSQFQKQSESLKAEVVAQEATEQTLVFVRDRLSKIKDLRQKNANNSDLIADKAVVDAFPPDTQLKQLELSQSASDFSVIVTDSNALSNVLEKMKTAQFQSGSIDTLSYNDQIGFQVKFKLR